MNSNVHTSATSGFGFLKRDVEGAVPYGEQNKKGGIPPFPLFLHALLFLLQRRIDSFRIFFDDAVNDRPDHQIAQGENAGENQNR